MELDKRIKLNDFTSFLEEHNLLDVFNTYRYFHSQEPLKMFIKDKLPRYYIIDAFKWGKTQEGTEFWDNINDEWVARIEN